MVFSMASTFETQVSQDHTVSGLGWRTGHVFTDRKTTEEEVGFTAATINSFVRTNDRIADRVVGLVHRAIEEVAYARRCTHTIFATPLLVVHTLGFSCTEQRLHSRIAAT